MTMFESFLKYSQSLQLSRELGIATQTVRLVRQEVITTLSAYYLVIGLYRIRLGLAPSSPKRLRLSASYS